MCGVLFLYGLGYTRQPPFQGNLRERLYEKTWSLLADSREGFSLWWPIRGGATQKEYFFQTEKVGISQLEVHEKVGKSVI